MRNNAMHRAASAWTVNASLKPQLIRVKREKSTRNANETLELKCSATHPTLGLDFLTSRRLPWTVSGDWLWLLTRTRRRRLESPVRAPRRDLAAVGAIIDRPSGAPSLFSWWWAPVWLTVSSLNHFPPWTSLPPTTQPPSSSHHPHPRASSRVLSVFIKRLFIQKCFINRPTPKTETTRGKVFSFSCVRQERKKWRS